MYIAFIAHFRLPGGQEHDEQHQAVLLRRQQPRRRAPLLHLRQPADRRGRALKVCQPISRVTLHDGQRRLQGDEPHMLRERRRHM